VWLSNNESRDEAMIFFDVDTQRDFMDSDGALYVPEAEAIKPNIERLLRAAGAYGITTISSLCAHERDDDEFKIFPPHCIDGTPGAARVFKELPKLPRVEIAVDAAQDAPKQIEQGQHYVVKKKVFDLFANAWLAEQRQRGTFREQTCVVFGVATDYCVRACGLGLAIVGAHVLLVEDAIRGVAAATTAQTITELRAAGVEFTTTDEVLKQLGDKQ
jgi:nicotinamidase/pyrazinamidase